MNENGNMTEFSRLKGVAYCKIIFVRGVKTPMQNLIGSTSGFSHC